MSCPPLPPAVTGRSRLNRPPSPGGGPARGRRSRPVAASGVAVASEPLPRAKRTEAKYLRSGFEMTLASVVTVACPTRGFPGRVAAADRGNATAVIVFEAARLLRKYPAFNAYHDDGVAHYYDEVNVGFAVDAGRGLKVPVIREADRKGITAIASEMRDLVVAYLDDALPVESLAGRDVHPDRPFGRGRHGVPPADQPRAVGDPGHLRRGVPAGSREGTFNLVLAFDHQLAEGRTAARFLGDLRDRLASHEASASKPGRRVRWPRSPAARGAWRATTTWRPNGHPLVQTVRADGSIRLLCKLCFEGWT